MPWRRIESARSARASGSKRLRGWFRPGPTWEMGEGDGALASGGQVRVAQQGVEPPAQTHLCFRFAIVHSFSKRVESEGEGESAASVPPGSFMLRGDLFGQHPMGPRPRGSRGRSPARAFRGWALRTDGRCGESPWRRPGRGSGA